MRVALVHDWLNVKVGGAERVLLELAELYPDAPVYTLLYRRELFGHLLDPKRVRVSPLQSLPDALLRRPRYLLPLIPPAIEAFDLSGFDVVVSSSSAFAKGVVTRPGTLHVCYCHSPMRFVWDYWPAYLSEQHVGPVRRTAILALTSRIRVWDQSSAARVDRWIANSHTTASRIAKYYRQPATVVHPPVDVQRFRPAAEKGDYHLVMAALSPYKRVDLAVAAFSQSGRRLLVAGEGSERKRLEGLAGPSVEFVGWVDETDKPALLARARALVVPAEEDFGIAPVEAAASGTALVAYGRGGLTETVVDGKTGVFFHEQTTAALNDAVDRLGRSELDPAVLVAHAARFGRGVFRERIAAAVGQAHEDHVRAT